MMSDITVHKILNLIPFVQGKIRKIHILFGVPLDQLILQTYRQYYFNLGLCFTQQVTHIRYSPLLNRSDKKQ